MLNKIVNTIFQRNLMLDHMLVHNTWHSDFHRKIDGKIEHLKNNCVWCNHLNKNIRWTSTRRRNYPIQIRVLYIQHLKNIWVWGNHFEKKKKILDKQLEEEETIQSILHYYMIVITWPGPWNAFPFDFTVPYSMTPPVFSKNYYCFLQRRKRCWRTDAWCWRAVGVAAAAGEAGVWN